ncbi:hypothetical protein E2562_020787 [Oryza meyeriana var. granulata]|uniref:Uncharacterized protein n=1 Tax=Oryza meyeriana var. granulata TaxID=110450 RepID=A0A6G1CG38_9ORYZ|nr:hypothetical protein E2562_020787 [Oryza meyeriana var. granulata]
MAAGGNSKKDGQDRVAQHWICWRDTLEGFLQSPGISQGGGIQTCIRDALVYNGCQPVWQFTNGVVHTELKGNLANSQGEAKEQHPDGAAEGKVVAADAAMEDAAAAACPEANKAMCNSALFDILVSQKFALLCHLLVGTFHVNKPGEVINLEKIDAKMRNGDYAQNPALFDDDIQQMWEKFEQVGQEMTGLASNLSTISRVSYQKQASGFSEVEVAEHRIELELVKPEEDPDLPSKIELAEEREGSSVSSMGEDNKPDLSTTALSKLCKHCGTCEDDDKRFMVAGTAHLVSAEDASKTRMMTR